jgi:hypothetical protein
VPPIRKPNWSVPSKTSASVRPSHK